MGRKRPPVSHTTTNASYKMLERVCRTRPSGMCEKELWALASSLIVKKAVFLPPNAQNNTVAQFPAYLHNLTTDPSLLTCLKCQVAPPTPSSAQNATCTPSFSITSTTVTAAPRFLSSEGNWHRAFRFP